jgi:hypothetical protein
MRESWLVFLHVTAGATAIGCLLATAIFLVGLPRLARRTAVAAAAAVLVTAVLGEVTRARESIDGHWLTVASAIAYAAVLLPSVAVVFLASIAGDRPVLARWTAALATAVATVAVAVAFLMAAKPS